MSTETIACAHIPCQCMVVAQATPETGDEPDEAFCSGYCRSRDEAEEEEMCACGHPACDSP